ncbi:MAG TPA: hypothetical protein VF144_18355 [Chitinophagaceae bacterium]
MEIHAHTHTPRKKWTHYFWEFLMLFLAVFCGFFAENQREHFIEHKREKQFILSLINDLKLDTVGLESKISRKKTKMLTIDSVLFPLTKLENDKLPVAICATLSRVTLDFFFFSNDGTIQQLKGSGGLRLVRNREAVDSIEAYHNRIKRFMLRQEAGVTRGIEFENLWKKFVNGKDYFENMFDSTYGLRPHNPDNVVKIDRQHLNELINALIYMRNFDKYDITLIGEVKKKAVNMIGLLRNRYHLK